MSCLQIQLLIFLAAATTASASRIDARKRVKEVSLLDEVRQFRNRVTNTTATGLVDITDIASRTLFSSSGYKCCCDKPKPDTKKNMLKGWLRGPIEYSGVCKVVETDKCGDIQVGANNGHNFLSTTDEKCEVKPEDVKAVYEKHGSPYNYCRGTRVMDGAQHFVAIPQASLNEKIAFVCEDGATPVDDGRARCVWSTFAAGKFENFACKSDEDAPPAPPSPIRSGERHSGDSVSVVNPLPVVPVVSEIDKVRQERDELLAQLEQMRKNQAAQQPLTPPALQPPAVVPPPPVGELKPPRLAPPPLPGNGGLRPPPPVLPPRGLVPPPPVPGGRGPPPPPRPPSGGGLAALFGARGAAPRGGGLVIKKAKPGEKFLTGPFKDFLKESNVKLLEGGELHQDPIRDLLDVDVSKGPKEDSDSTSSNSDDSQQDTVKEAPPKKLPPYHLESLKMRAISIARLLSKVENKLKELETPTNLFLEQLASKDEDVAKEAIAKISGDRELVENLLALIGEVTEEDEATALGDDVLMGKAEVPPEYKGISPQAQFVASLGSKRTKLLGLSRCLAFAYEADELMAKANIGDKLDFFASEAPMNLVSSLDESISSFLWASFDGMPDKRDNSLYSKLERTLKTATTKELPGRSDEILLPLLFVSNVLNNNRKEQRIRAQKMSEEPTGILSPYILDVFLAFAKTNPKAAKPTYLDEIERTCGEINNFKELNPMTGAGVQWYQLNTGVKSRVGTCKNTVPAIADRLNAIDTKVTASMDSLMEVIKASVKAAGSISAKFAKNKDEPEKDLLDQVKKIALTKSTQDFVPEAFVDNELLDDENLRKVLVTFCTRVSERTPEMGSFKTVGNETA